MVRNGSGDQRGGSGQVGRTTRSYWTGRRNLPVFLNGLGNLPKGPGRVSEPSRKSETGWGPSLRSGTGRETLREVWDGSGGPLEGLEWVGGPFRRSGTGWGTIPKVWDGSGDPQRGQGRVVRPTWRSGTGREILPEVRDGSGNLHGSPAWIGGPSQESGTGWGTVP